MNVLIFPSDDRLGQASLIDHYNKIGCNVYIPKIGTLNLNWSKMSVWPSLLCCNETGHRNIETYVLSPEEKNNLFGEDNFLYCSNFYQNVKLNNLPKCQFVNFEEISNLKIDAYHTLRGADSYLHSYKNIAKKYFPNAIWISSTLSVYNHQPEGMKPHLLAKIIPANYSNIKEGINIFCSDVEFRLFGFEDIDIYDREPVVSSFNHNYHVRQPEDFAFFCEMNKQIEKTGNLPVLNYGGNIRAMGADIRYSGNGPTGNYTTLSPYECLKKIRKLSAIVHFKGTDWGGGVFFHALHTSTPLITTERYVRVSNSSDYLIHNYNCLIVKNPIEAAYAVLQMINDKQARNHLIDGMKKTKEKIFNDEYWTSWENFTKNGIK